MIIFYRSSVCHMYIRKMYSDLHNPISESYNFRLQAAACAMHNEAYCISMIIL